MGYLLVLELEPWDLGNSLQHNFYCVIDKMKGYPLISFTDI